MEEIEKEKQVLILLHKMKTKVRKDKEKNLVEEIQVDQMVILKFQNHHPFPFALLHP